MSATVGQIVATLQIALRRAAAKQSSPPPGRPL
jgi:hypothetical protein